MRGLTAQSRQVRMVVDTLDELCRLRADVLKGTAPKPLELVLAQFINRRARVRR